MIKLVVFDWNGTLLADAQPVVEGVNKEMEVLGLPPISLKDYREYYDIPLTNFYSHFGVSTKKLGEKSAEMARAFHAFYEPRVAKARTRLGTKYVLKELEAKGTLKAILSNHTMEGIYLQLERLNLTQYFNAVLANEVIGQAHFKGKHERLEEYLKLQKVKPSSAAIVGDTIEEIRIGKNLGLKTIAITGGYNSTKRLKQAKPDMLIHKLNEIIDFIEEL